MRTLYRNGVVLTMDVDATRTDAFLVEGDRFVAVGPAAVDLAGDAEVVDLRGRTVVPGLIDAHTHLETSAMSNESWLDLRDISKDVALERIKEHAATRGPGAWIIGQSVIGQSLPDRAQLDAVAGDHPLVIRDMHSQTANTMALDRAGLLTSKHAPTGVIVRREAGGAPTGYVREGYHLFPVTEPATEQIADYVEKEIRERFNRFGVTTIYEVPFSSRGMAAFQLLDRSDRLTARISLNPAIKPGLQPLIDDIDHWARMGIQSGFGNSRLWIGGAKFFLDGNLEGSFDIDRDRKHPRSWGAPTHHFTELVRALVIGYESGIQCWIHALGEDAENLALDAVAEAQRLHGGDSGLRTRLEHVFNDRRDAELVQRVRDANIIPVPNAVFVHLDVVDGVYAYRTAIDNGFMPPGNSDNAGSQPFATNPWFGIGKMRTRRNKSGGVPFLDEQTSVYEGIQTYTTFAARAGFREGRLGVIAPDATADFAVLTRDPFTVPDDELDAIESELTVLGGQPVWDAR